ncbi:hypothetical protein ACFL35_16195 [Candidatus Riflebacteria bacterium]
MCIDQIEKNLKKIQSDLVANIDSAGKNLKKNQIPFELPEKIACSLAEFKALKKQVEDLSRDVCIENYSLSAAEPDLQVVYSRINLIRELRLKNSGKIKTLKLLDRLATVKGKTSRDGVFEKFYSELAEYRRQVMAGETRAKDLEKEIETGEHPLCLLEEFIEGVTDDERWDELNYCLKKHFDRALVIAIARKNVFFSVGHIESAINKSAKISPVKAVEDSEHIEETKPAEESPDMESSSKETDLTEKDYIPFKPDRRKMVEIFGKYGIPAKKYYEMDIEMGNTFLQKMKEIEHSSKAREREIKIFIQMLETVEKSAGVRNPNFRFIVDNNEKIDSSLFFLIKDEMVVKQMFFSQAIASLVKQFRAEGIDHFFARVFGHEEHESHKSKSISSVIESVISPESNMDVDVLSTLQKIEKDKTIADDKEKEPKKEVRRKIVQPSTIKIRSGSSKAPELGLEPSEDVLDKKELRSTKEQKILLKQPEMEPSRSVIEVIAEIPELLIYPEFLRIGPDTIKGNAEKLISVPFRENERLVTRLIWHTFHKRFFSITYQLTEMLEISGGKFEHVIPSWFVRLIVLGARFHPEDPEMVKMVQDDCSIFDERRIFRKKEGKWNQALSILCLSGTILPSVLAPHTGAGMILKWLKFPGCPSAFFKLSNVFSAYSDLGVPLNLNTIKSRKDPHKWEQEQNQLINEARELLETLKMKKNSIISKPARIVWKDFCRDDGLIYRFLQPVYKQDESRLEELRDLVIKYGHRDAIEAYARKVHRKVCKKGATLLQKALVQIVRCTQYAVTLTSKWIKLQDSHPGKSYGTLDSKALSLKKDFMVLYPGIKSWLNNAIKEEDELPLLTSMEILNYTLCQVENYLNSEVSIPDWNYKGADLLEIDLVRIPSLPRKTGWVLEKNPQNVGNHLSKIFSYLSKAEPNWQNVFEDYCDKGNHEGTSKVLEYIEKGLISVENPKLLKEKIQKDCHSHKTAVREKIRDTGGVLSDAVSMGLLNEKEYTQKSGDINRIETLLSTTRRFDLLRKELREIEQSIHQLKKDRIEGVRKELKKIKNISASQKIRVEKVLDQGDVHTANDYIEKIKKNEPLPEAEDRKHFFLDFFNKYDNKYPKGRFFEIEDTLTGKASRKLNIGQVINRIKNRDSHLFGMNFKAITGIQAEQAEEVLNIWFGIKKAGRIKEKDAEIILNWLGFNTLSVEIFTRGDVTSLVVSTDPVMDRRRIPVGLFGSEANGEYEILCVWDRPSEENLLSLIDKNPGRGGVLVFHFGRLTETILRDLAWECKDPEMRRKFAILDDTLLLYLCSQRGSRLPVFFECSLPLSYLEPFTTTPGLVAPEMFYGRRRQFESLIDPKGSCFVYGGRQLGKTVLLRYVEKSFHNPKRGQIAIYIDLKTRNITSTQTIDDFWSIISEVFKSKEVLPRSTSKNLKPVTLLEKIRKWIETPEEKGRRRRIILLLDEADRFLESDGNDTREGNEPFSRCSLLKGLMEDTKRRFKVIFAGLHNVQRTTRVANNPLAHFGEPICIGPLMDNGEGRAARELIEKPLACLGYLFEGPDPVTRILAQTNYYPSLIQIYCLHLLRHLTTNNDNLFDRSLTPPFIISARHVEDAYQSRNLRKDILDRFRWTLDLDKRYRVVAYLLALYNEDFPDGCDVSWIRQQCMVFWESGFQKNISEDSFKVLLEEMVGLGILRRVLNTGRFALRSPNVVSLLGTREEVEAELESCNNWEPEIEYEPQNFRRVISSEDTIYRSPLTALQERRIKGDKNGVFIICASEPAGIERLPEALFTLFEKENIFCPDEASNINEFYSFFDGLKKRREEFPALVFVNAEQQWDMAWVKVARKRIDRFTSKKSMVSVVFVADVEKVWQFIGTITGYDGDSYEVLSLSPFEDLSLRRLLEDCHAGPQDQSGRKEIATVTGNWPLLLLDFLEKIRSEGTNLEHALESMKSHFSEITISGKSIFKCFGLQDNIRFSILKVLADYDDSLKLEEILELVPAYLDSFSPGQVKRVLNWANLMNFICLEGKGWRLNGGLHTLISNHRNTE